MDIKQLLVIASSGTAVLAFATISFRKALFTWILLAGVIGIPILVVRQSHLMFSELLLAPLLFLWFMKKKLGLGFIKLSELSRTKTNIENSMWAMIGAFTISTVFNLILKDPSVGGTHMFVMGKLMALFLYIAPVMAALVVADSIDSFDDVRRICFLLITLGIFTFIAVRPVNQLLPEEVKDLLRGFQGDVGWPWMSVTILFSFSLAYLVFHPKITKKVQNVFVSFVIGLNLITVYLSGAATYKAIILANCVLVLTILYFRSRVMAFSIFCITIITFLATFHIYTYYVEQERQEGTWGRRGSARPVVWQHSLVIFAERPIFGVGPYNYYDYSLYVASKRTDRNRNWGVMTSPHGQYVQILVETGAIGALAFSWFMIELFRLLKYFMKLNSDYRINIIASAIAAILVSRLAVGLVGDYVIPQYHNGGLQTFCSTVYFWVCLGILIGLKRIVMLEDKQTEG